MYKNNLKDFYVVFDYSDKGIIDTYSFKVAAKNEKHAIAVFGYKMGEEQSIDLDCLMNVKEAVDYYDITSEDYQHVRQW